MQKKTVVVVALSVGAIALGLLSAWLGIKIGLLHSHYAIETSVIAEASAKLQKHWDLNGEWPEIRYIYDDSLLNEESYSEEEDGLIYIYRSGLNERLIKFHLSIEGEVFVVVE